MVNVLISVTMPKTLCGVGICMAIALAAKPAIAGDETLPKVGERSLRILDARFASPVRRDEKRRWRRRVYASHYLTYADKYFGFQMNADARRCYWHAARLRPAMLFNPGVARRFAATLGGRRSYDALKGLVLQPDKRTR